MEEVTRNLNLEKLLPCYKYTVSVACLKVIRILQKFGHLPSNPHLFRAYAAYGQFIGKILNKSKNFNCAFDNTNNFIILHEYFYNSHLISLFFLDIRVAALEALVDFTRVDGKWEDLEFLLDMAEMDPHPGVRHRLVRLMVENPPFEKAHKHRLDKPDLVDRIWNLIKYDIIIVCKNNFSLT